MLNYCVWILFAERERCRGNRRNGICWSNLLGNCKKRAVLCCSAFVNVSYVLLHFCGCLRVCYMNRMYSFGLKTPKEATTAIRGSEYARWSIPLCNFVLFQMPDLMQYAYLIQDPCCFLRISAITSCRLIAVRVSGRLMGYSEPSGSDKLQL